MLRKIAYLDLWAWMTFLLHGGTLTLYSIGYFLIMTSFSILRQHWKKFKKNLSKVLNTFENIMENGAFAPKGQMLHSPWYFQIHDISKASKGIILV